MKVAFFSTKPYDETSFRQTNATSGNATPSDDRGRGSVHEITFFEPRLTATTAPLAAGFDAVCVFVNDQLDAPVVAKLAAGGTRVIALRSAGYNHVDLAAAQRASMHVVRVPAYSPYAVAEHAVGLILTLNRKIHRGYNRVRDGNFALEGLLGFDLHGRTMGIVGTGKIGQVVARILAGFGCVLLAYDPYPTEACTALGVEYVPLSRLLRESDVVTLHCPLTPETHHVIDGAALDQMRDGVMLINTSRGALIDTPAVVEALKSGKIGYLGLDVYEEEGGLFFEDLSGHVIQDDVFSRLLTFPNVLITGHQAFFTREALHNIAETTLANLTEIERTGRSINEVATQPGGAGV